MFIIITFDLCDSWWLDTTEKYTCRDKGWQTIKEYQFNSLHSLHCTFTPHVHNGRDEKANRKPGEIIREERERRWSGRNQKNPLRQGFAVSTLLLPDT